MSGKKISIKAIRDLPLRIVLITMHRVVGIQGPHQASRAHLLYALEAMAPTVYKWDEALLPIFKDQLAKFRQGELK